MREISISDYRGRDWMWKEYSSTSVSIGSRMGERWKNDWSDSTEESCRCYGMLMDELILLYDLDSVANLEYIWMDEIVIFSLFS